MKSFRSLVRLVIEARALCPPAAAEPLLGRLASKTLEAYSLKCLRKMFCKASMGSAAVESCAHCTMHFL